MMLCTVIIGYIVYSFLKRRSKYGVVRSKTNKKRLMHVLVQLLDKKTGAIVDTRFTDEKGRYQLFAPKGKYILRVAHPGYEEVRKDVVVEERETYITEDFELSSIRR